MEFNDILYHVDDGVGVITLNRPQQRNAQSWRMLEEIDKAFDLARDDTAVRVVVIRGSEGCFSAGHDLGSGEGSEYRAKIREGGPLAYYDGFKRYNLDLLLKWRNFEKPTIALVEGWCIYAGWMLAACMDIVFAADDARFLAGFVEYMSIPWDIGARKAKELIFESRFITATEAHELGFVNRLYAPADLERETFAYARRVAENSAGVLRFAKLQINKAQDAAGFSHALEDSLGDYVAMMTLLGPGEMRTADGKKMLAVDLANQGRRGLRHGQIKGDLDR